MISCTGSCTALPVGVLKTSGDIFVGPGIGAGVGVGAGIGARAEGDTPGVGEAIVGSKRMLASISSRIPPPPPPIGI